MGTLKFIKVVYQICDVKIILIFHFSVAIVIMIFANYGCGSYKILNHARWNGLHLADLVFPWFMWIMGVCIPISLTSSLKKNISDRTIVKKIIEVSINSEGFL